MKNPERKLKVELLLIFCLSICLVGCGGGGGGTTINQTPEDNNSDDNAPPDEISGLTLNVGPESKTLNFSWMADSNSTHYRIYENADGNSEYIQLGQDLAANQTTFSHVVPLFLRTSAQYQFDNCNGNGCSSTHIELTPNVDNNWLTSAVVEVLPDIPGNNIFFGDQISMNSDANILVVGALSDKYLSPGVYTDTTLVPEEEALSVGAVYIYEREADSVDWQQGFYLKASNPDDNDQFGRSVSISADGTTIAVGAYGESSNGIDGEEDNSLVRAGAAYIFVKQEDTWVQQAYIKPLDPAVNSGFGNLIALSEDGNTLAVANSIDAGAGAVYIFTRENNAWAQQAKVQAPEPAGSDRFGGSIWLTKSGDRLFVGATNAATPAPGENDLEQNRGAVFIFSADNGGWNFRESLLALDGQANDRFGSSVTLSGDEQTLAIGARGSNNSLGAVYLYNLNSENWVIDAKLQSSNPENGDFFGFSTSLNNDGTALAVGAPWKKTFARGINDTERELETASILHGMVYTFSRNEGAWQQTAFISDQGRTTIGISVLLNGSSDMLIVGASSRLLIDAPNPAPGGAVLIY